MIQNSLQSNNLQISEI